MTKLSASDLEIIKEAAKLGSENSSIAFSQLLNKPIQTSIPKVSLVSKTNLSKFFDKEQALTVVFFQVRGLNVTMAVVYTRENVLKTIDVLLKNPVNTTKFVGDIGQSAIKEASNILVGSYLTALSAWTKNLLLPSTPMLAYNFSGESKDFDLYQKESIKDFILVKTQLNSKNVEITADVLLMLTEKSSEELVSQFKSKKGVRK